MVRVGGISMAKVLLKNVYKIYGLDIMAVKDFNLEIEDKEFIVLVGPSGCGKSTTLRMIAGLEEISKGEIYIEDTLVNDVEPKDRDIAMVFQNYALYPHMSVYENMAFGLKLKKMPKVEIDNKVKQVARILDIEENLKRRPSQLSGGQRQRVAIGRAMVREPKVFLMDEPLSNLDAKLRVQMRIEIAKLHKKLNSTFIYVTHDQIEAMTLGTRIVVMNEGIIQQVGTPSNIYNNPNNMFVAGFIGSPQMNFIDGKIIYENHSVHVKIGHNEIKISECKKIKLKEYIGKEVILGIRPENITCYKYKIKGMDLIECNIEMIENMGSDQYVHVKFEDTNLIARCPQEHELKYGESIYLNFNEERINIFHKESEKNLMN